MSTSPFVIILISLLIVVFNVLIIFTLRKTKQFSREMKLHLGVTAICDVGFGIFIFLRMILQLYYGVISVGRCKIILLGMIIMSAVKVNTMISMSLECIYLLQPPGSQIDRNRCLTFRGWKPTRNGAVRITLIVMLALLPIQGYLIPSEPQSGMDYECTSLNWEVCHPVSIKIWAAECAICTALNELLLGVLMYRLWRYSKKSNEMKKAAEIKKNTGRIGGRNSNMWINFTQRRFSNWVGNKENETTRETRLNSINPVLVDPAGLQTVPAPIQSQQVVPLTQSMDRRKSRVTLMMLTVAFFTVSYAPFIITFVLYIFCPDQCGVKTQQSTIATNFTVLHGLLNVFLYFGKDAAFRAACLKLIGLRRGQVATTEST